MDQIRIYYGNTIQHIQLDRTRIITFGEGQKYTYQFPRGVCPTAVLQFSCQNGNWHVSCKGDVLHNGRTVTNLNVKHGDFFVLNKDRHFALQLICRQNTPPVCVPLAGLQELLIGREENCTVQLKDNQISRGHAKLYLRGDAWYLCDIASTNGTYVNGELIRECALCEQDTIVIGTYELIFSTEQIQIYGDAGKVLLHLPEISVMRGEYPYFTRSPRILKEMQTEELEIEAAPELGAKPEINWLSVILPVCATLAASIILTAISGGTGMLFSIPMMLAGIIVTISNHKKQKKKFAQNEQNLQEKYREYIRGCEKKLEDAERRQRDAEMYANPSPEHCMKLVRSLNRRLWERTSGDADFLSARIGMGRKPLQVKIQTPKLGFILNETEYTRIPQELAKKHQFVEGLPVCCDLLRFPTLGVIGSREDVLSAVRSMTVQIATQHGYDEVKFVALFSQTEQKSWEWMRWLPHTYNEIRTFRYLATTKYEATQILEPLADEFKRRADERSNGWKSGVGKLPHYIFLIGESDLVRNQPIADYLLSGKTDLGVSCILMGKSLGELPGGVLQIFNVCGEKSELYLREHPAQKQEFSVDEISVEECDLFARAMAPIRLPEKNSMQLLPDGITFLQGYHVRRPDELDLEDYWSNSCNYQSMSVPIGVRANGENFYFDIHEKKHGPHGLIAGTTGSGKSEMMQSWILSMALQFSPQDVSFVLIDFKGTGLILPFENLPHLAGTISDLDTNIQRNLIALQSELQRRKALFDHAGVKDITAYLKQFRAGKVRESLSYLFVVIDEYAEFKTKFPEFTSAVNSLFQTGRSLGVHIILLTQNPAGVVSEHSESNVRFRWCLRVASIAASKEVLGGHDDAAYITHSGRAYVRVGNDEIFEPVQSFYSGASYLPDRKDEQAAEPEVASISLTGKRFTDTRQESVKREAQSREIDAIVNYIREYTERHRIPDARRIWQNRLPGHISLPQLLQRAEKHKDGELQPVVGVLDDPARQSQMPLHLPLSSDGHAVIYGAPGAGKTVFLQTLIVSLCMEYTPEEVNLYLMDFAGWSMGMFRDYPQVIETANDNEEDRVTAIANAIEIALNQRKQLFSRVGVGTLKAYLQATGEKLPYLVLILDNFAPVYHLYPQLEDLFIRIGREGGNYGVYLVTTAGNPMALGYKLNQSIKTGIALQMTDYSDYSAIVGRTDGLVPEKLPGRGLFRGNSVLEFQTAFPADIGGEGAYATELRELGKTLSERWEKPNVRSIMPEVVRIENVCAEQGGLVLGLDVRSLKTVELLPEQHHLLISAQNDGGKLLRALQKQAVQSDARILWYAEKGDYPENIEKLSDGAEADLFLEKLAQELTARQAEKKENPGAEFVSIYLIIDGYKKFFEEISQQSVSRLRALVMMGSGLGVKLIVADQPAAFNLLTEYQEPLTVLLAQGPAVLLGGKSLDHTAINLSMKSIEKNTLLAKGEGWYYGEKEVCRFRMVVAE